MFKLKNKKKSISTRFKKILTIVFFSLFFISMIQPVSAATAPINLYFSRIDFSESSTITMIHEKGTNKVEWTMYTMLEFTAGTATPGAYYINVLRFGLLDNLYDVNDGEATVGSFARFSNMYSGVFTGGSSRRYCCHSSDGV